MGGRWGDTREKKMQRRWGKGTWGRGGEVKGERRGNMKRWIEESEGGWGERSLKRR